MGAVNKTLGQSAPSAAVETMLYECPSLSEADGVLTMCNRSGVADPIRIRIVPDGQVAGDKHYLAYDYELGGNLMVDKSGIRLEAGTAVYVYSTNGTTSFSLIGMVTS